LIDCLYTGIISTSSLFFNDDLLIAESPAGQIRGQEPDEEEERMVLEDQPLVSEAVATLLAEVVSQTDEVRQG
jgi:hypothetical protein